MPRSRLYVSVEEVEHRRMSRNQLIKSFFARNQVKVWVGVMDRTATFGEQDVTTATDAYDSVVSGRAAERHTVETSVYPLLGCHSAVTWAAVAQIQDQEEDTEDQAGSHGTSSCLSDCCHPASFLLTGEELQHK